MTFIETLIANGVTLVGLLAIVAFFLAITLAAAVVILAARRR